MSARMLWVLAVACHNEVSMYVVFNSNPVSMITCLAFFSCFTGRFLKPAQNNQILIFIIWFRKMQLLFTHTLAQMVTHAEAKCKKNGGTE